MRTGDNAKLDNLYRLLAGVDETFSNLPLNMRLQIEKITQGLTEFGPRKLRRRGLGTEFWEARDFQPEVDEPRAINARLSARAGKPVVVEREAEIRQHFYLWRDGSPSMNFASDPDLYTKKQAAEVMLLAFARHLARNEEMIGVLDGKGMYRGGKAHERLAHQIIHDNGPDNVTIATGGLPAIGRKLPRNSTVVMFSDFIMPDLDELTKSLDRMTGIGLKGYLVMVLDPQELDFNYKGHVKFSGLEGEDELTLKRADSLRSDYLKAIRDHMERIERIAAAKNFKFILQRTDQPLHTGLMAIYGQTLKSPAPGPALGL